MIEDGKDAMSSCDASEVTRGCTTSSLFKAPQPLVVCQTLEFAAFGKAREGGAKATCVGPGVSEASSESEFQTWC